MARSIAIRVPISVRHRQLLRLTAPLQEREIEGT
jgi:hypothetical protein